MVNVAVKAAREAGKIINRAALDIEAVRITQKQVNDFVTDVDKASEAIIIETLLKPTQGTASWLRNQGRNMVQKILITSGSSTRWTAPPTSFMACRCIASALPWQ